MDKAYTRQNFVNNSEPALNATNLNKIDYALDTIDDRVVSQQAKLADNDKQFVFGYLDGTYGYYEDESRGADTFHPFKEVTEPYIEETYDEDDKLTNVILHGYKTLRTGAFYSCTKLESIELPSEITTINPYTFFNCNNLVLSSIPTTITEIGNYAFYGCYEIALTELPSNITDIGSYAFYGCVSITITKLPNNLQTLSSYAFSQCNGLTSISMPTYLKSISNNVFQDCKNLQTVSFMSLLTYIGNYAFRGCTNLRLFDLPSNITYIGSGAFYDCGSIAISALPLSLQYLGNVAFRNCTGLTNLYIYSQLTSIDASSVMNSPFYGCSSSLILRCQATSKPSGWSTYWNYYASGSQLTVVWGA